MATGELSESRRDQDAPEGELGFDEEGRLVPLRPVSELGLVDITDVPRRDRAATPRPSKRAATQQKPDAGRRVSKKPAGTAEPHRKAKREGPQTAERSTGKSTPRHRSGNAATASPRSRSRSKAVPGTRSASAPRGTTSSRRSSAGSRPKTSPASRQAERSRTARTPARRKPSSAAKIRIAVLTGGGVLAAGLLFGRAAHHR